jgi:hypothetical protein
MKARNDDMILTGGYNAPGPEVGAAQLKHPKVGDRAKKSE